VTAAEIAGALHGKRSGRGWIARCPAHDDKSPSLSLHDVDGKVFVIVYLTQGLILGTMFTDGLLS
jgi:hypothetical protein